MRFMVVLVAVLMSGCFMDPMDNPDVQSVFMTDADRPSMIPVELRSSFDTEDYEVDDDCDSERYECEIDESAE